MEKTQIIEEKENNLFGRKEIVLKVHSENPLNFGDCEKLVSEKFSKPVENIAVRQIKGTFGANIFNISAFVYKSKEDKDKTEPKKKEKKK